MKTDIRSSLVKNPAFTNWISTKPAILFLLGSSWQPFENVTAFPVLSIVTLVALGGVGLFGGLTCVFVGTELRGVRERYFRNVD